MAESIKNRDGSRLAGGWRVLAVAAFVAVAFLAARVPALDPAPPAAAQTVGQTDAPDYENDPEWLEELRRSEEDAKAFQEDAEAFYRELTGEPEPAAATDTAAGAAPAQDATARRETVVAIQTTLQAAGCYTMKVDGLWGAGSRRATAEFARRRGLDLDASEPTPELAALLDENHSGGRVCPLVCDARHEVRGDACVLKTCAKGQALDAKGVCRAAPSPAGKTAGKATPQSCPQDTGRASDGRCWPMRNGNLCRPSIIENNIERRTNICRYIIKRTFSLARDKFANEFFRCNC